jgi:hypothetical protein
MYVLSLSITGLTAGAAPGSESVTPAALPTIGESADAANSHPARCKSWRRLNVKLLVLSVPLGLPLLVS